MVRVFALQSWIVIVIVDCDRDGERDRDCLLFIVYRLSFMEDCGENKCTTIVERVRVRGS